ncbi:hypothetical protein [Bacteroides sp.]|uniref:hypothetical protein n=1 Tax=Bacteroides sp. TaxID=29523 RepID=UPI00262B5B6A|nr:hypothetical protein [Bacteroides sp.]MDD3036494.1 hypothetical protein [Bacteroides sp.]
MITKRQVEIFKAYEGYIDIWALRNKKEEKESMSDDDWRSISKLLIEIANTKQDVRKLLEEKVEDKEAIDELIEMAKTYEKYVFLKPT